MRVCFSSVDPPFFRGESLEQGHLGQSSRTAIDWSNLVVQSWRRGRVLLFLPNEREAKLAASFDPEGIKIVLLMEVERSGLNVSLSVWCTAGKDIQHCSEESEAGLVHGTARRSDTPCVQLIRTPASTKLWSAASSSLCTFNLLSSAGFVRLVLCLHLPFLFVSNFLPESYLCFAAVTCFPCVYVCVCFYKQLSLWCTASISAEGSRSEVFDSLSVCSSESRLESIRSFWYAQRRLGQPFEGSPEKH